MTWPAFILLPQCKSKRHAECPEYLLNKGEKVAGCICECHTRGQDEDKEEE